MRAEGERVAHWRDELLDPATMSTEDIRDELRHDLNVYEQAQHPLSKAAMVARVNALVAEMDKRFAPQPPLARDPEWPLVDKC